jgi:hypothetical protein
LHADVGAVKIPCGNQLQQPEDPPEFLLHGLFERRQIGAGSARAGRSAPIISLTAGAR